MKRIIPLEEDMKVASKQPFIRPVDPEHPSPVEAARAADTTLKAHPLVNFENTQVAFCFAPTSHLKRAKFLFTSLQNSFLANTGPKLLNFAIKAGLPVQGLTKRYMFDHFCGGEDLAEAQQTMTNLLAHQVYSVLDYAVEGENTDISFDHTLQTMLQILDFAKDSEACKFVAMKMTGIGAFSVLEKVHAGKKLSPFENAQYERTKERLDKICAKAAELDQAIYIDAEETWIQDPVDELVEEMMVKYNTEKPIIYTTVQMYRHDRLAYLKDMFKRVRLRQAYPGVKLVRGAYMEKERARAKKLGYDDPIQPSKQACDADFDEAACYILERIDKIGLCLGTHNEASCKMVAEHMDKHGIALNHPNMFFAQLYGMSDNITFNVAAAGYNTAKYLPFGPVKSAIPYLLRRASENSSISGQTPRELELITREISRRRKCGTFRKLHEEDRGENVCAVQ